MRRWKLTIEYDGSGFCGWQRQTKDISVQETLETAIFKFSHEKVTLHVAGRTDTGVHARAQVAHVDLEKDVEARAICDAINFYVRPHRVSVLKAEAVSDEFHARFKAVARSYRYTILRRRGPPALLLNQVWHHPKTLAIEPMQEAAELLIGQHDFSTFRAQHCQANSPIRTLDQMRIVAEDDKIIIDIQARSFLYHQVRNMVGTLSLLGTGYWTLDTFKAAFAAKDRSLGGPTAPAQGLCFWGVTYPEHLSIS